MNLNEMYKLISISRKSLKEVISDYEQLATAGIEEEDIFQQLFDYYSEEVNGKS